MLRTPKPLSKSTPKSKSARRSKNPTSPRHGKPQLVSTTSQLRSFTQSKRQQIVNPSLHRTFSTSTTQAKSNTNNNNNSNHYLIIGLGNKGDNYTNTRHNIGKDVVLKLSKLLGAPLDRDSNDCFHSEPIELSKIIKDRGLDVVLLNNLPKKQVAKTPKPPSTQNTQNIQNTPSHTTIITQSTANASETKDEPSTEATPSPNDDSFETINITKNPEVTKDTPEDSIMAKDSTTSENPKTTSKDPPLPNSTTKSQKSPKKPPSFIPLESLPLNTIITLAYPNSYMNVSGRPVHRLAQALRIQPQNVFVLHDDLEVKCGQIKVKNSGSHGGQNGLRNLLDVMGHNAPFARVRLGIGRPGNSFSLQTANVEVADYVLGKMSPGEKEQGKFFDKYILDTISQIICYGPDLASQHIQNFYHSYQIELNPPAPKVAKVSRVPGTVSEVNKTTPSPPPKKSKVDIMGMFGM